MSSAGVTGVQREAGGAAVTPTALQAAAQLQRGTAGHAGCLTTAPLPGKAPALT